MARPSAIKQDPESKRYYFNFKPHGHPKTERFFRILKAEAEALLAMLTATKKACQRVDVENLKVDPDFDKGRIKTSEHVSPTFGGLAVRYLHSLKGSVNDATISKLNYQLSPVVDNLPNQKTMSLTKDIMVNAIMAAHPGSSTTRAEVWNACQKVLNFHATPPSNKTAEFATIPFNPLASVSQPFRRNKHGKQLVLVDDFEKMVDFCLTRKWPGDKEFLALVLFLQQTGARAYEVRRVLPRWVVPDLSLIDVPEGEQKHGTPKRVIRYPALLAPVIHRRLSESEGNLLFTTTEGLPWSDRSFKRRLRTMKLRHVYSMTCFRHSFATDMARRGASANDIRLAMGHTDIDTAIRFYIKPVEDQLNSILSVEVNSARMHGASRSEIAKLEASIRKKFESADPRLAKAVNKAIKGLE